MRFVLILCLICLNSSAMASHSGALSKLKGLNGQSWSQQRSSEYTIIQFLAAWCQGCGPTLEKLDSIVQGTGVNLVPVSVDEDIDAAQQYFKSKKMMAPYRSRAFWDPDANLAKSLKVEAIPSVIILNGKGKETMRVVGHPNAKQLAALKGLITKKEVI